MILYPDLLPLCIAMITLCKAKKSAEKSGKKVDAIPIPTDDVKFAFDYQRVALVIQNWFVVWNMNFMNSHILGIMVPTDYPLGISSMAGNSTFLDDVPFYCKIDRRCPS